MENLIVLKDVRKVYARGAQAVVALDKINLCIKKKNITAIMGPSGRGKSTPVNLLGGLDRPTSGEIWAGGKAAHCFSDTEWTLQRRRRVGIVFQFFNLLERLTAFENVMLPLLLRGEPSHLARSTAQQSLQLVGLAAKR